MCQDTHCDVVCGEEAGEAAGAVVDGELGAVLVEAARLAAVVLVVQHCNTRSMLLTVPVPSNNAQSRGQRDAYCYFNSQVSTLYNSDNCQLFRG